MHPSGQFFPKRAYYGLQLGTGTYDGLFGFTYTGKLDAWSWGLIYRGRAALGDNDAGYLRGLSNEISAWGGYEVLPGLAATGRVAATIWDRIYGHDDLIWGAQQGTVPDYQGGERVKLLGGLRISAEVRRLEADPARRRGGSAGLSALERPPARAIMGAQHGVEFRILTKGHSNRM